MFQKKAVYHYGHPQQRTGVDALMDGYVIFDVEYFADDTAKNVATAMSAAADDEVRRICNRVFLDQVQLAQKKLERTQDQHLKATLNVTDFRNKRHDIDPQSAAIGQVPVCPCDRVRISRLRRRVLVPPPVRRR